MQHIAISNTEKGTDTGVDVLAMAHQHGAFIACGKANISHSIHYDIHALLVSYMHFVCSPCITI